METYSNASAELVMACLQRREQKSHVAKSS